MRLFVRVYANCEDEANARCLSERLAFSLSKFSPTEEETSSRYWKIPEYFEFTFLLSPADEQTYQSVLQLSNGDWHHYGKLPDISSVWNRRDNNTFLIPEVAWAEVQLYEEAPQPFNRGNKQSAA